MAVIVTDNRTIRNEADSITDWTGPTISVFTSDPDPAEATGSIGGVVSSTTAEIIHTGAAVDLTGKLVFVWVNPKGAMDTLVNGGIAILLGDGTNRVGYHLGGSDVSPFRHDTGIPEWQCMVFDEASRPPNKTVRAGSEAALNFAAITQMGAMFKTLAKSKGGVANCWVDILRFGDPAANNGAMLSITGGTDADPGKFSQIVTEDRSSANQKAFGIIRELGEGLFGLQGALRFGDAVGTTSSVFRDKNVAVAFEKRGLATTRYKIVIVGNTTGTTEFTLGTKVGSGPTATGADGCVLISPSGVGAEFDSTNANATTVNIYGSTFTGYSNGIKLRSANEFIGNTVNDSGTIEPNGCICVQTKVTGALTARALLWNSATDTDGKLDGMVFTKGTPTAHAIELGPSTPSSMTFRGIKFIGYGANETTSAAVFNNSGGARTINITAGGDTPTVRNGAGASTTVVNTVTLRVKVIDELGAAIAGAQVGIFRVSDGAQLMNETTIADGTATESFAFVSNTDVRVRVRKGSGGVDYVPVDSPQTITSAGLDVTITLIEDAINTL